MWQILIHPLVEKEDFKQISRSDQQLIIKAIRKKLVKAPEQFGKPLSGSLKGFWRLRVQDYRVIYTIQNQQVIVKVVKIGIRRDSQVYEEMLKRIPHLVGG